MVGCLSFPIRKARGVRTNASETVAKAHATCVVSPRSIYRVATAEKFRR